MNGITSTHALAWLMAALLGAMPLAPAAAAAPDAAQRGPGAYQEPAYAAGYAAGHERGLTDGRSGERYDPVRHRDYREAEDGYTPSYGSREAYRTNYRAGFRQGYESGYRKGAGQRG